MLSNGDSVAEKKKKKKKRPEVSTEKRPELSAETPELSAETKGQRACVHPSTPAPPAPRPNAWAQAPARRPPRGTSDLAGLQRDASDVTEAVQRRRDTGNLVGP